MNNNKPLRIIFGMGIFVIVMVLLIQLLGSGQGMSGLLTGAAPKRLSASEFDRQLADGKIESIQWQLDRLSGKLRDGSSFTTLYNVTPESEGGRMLKERIDTQVQKNNLTLEMLPPPASAYVLQILSIFLPILVIGLLFWFFVIRPGQNGGNQAMNFGRSRAKRAGESTPKVTFEDVAGIEEAKAELFEIVDFLKNTKKYVALGAKIPKGILLTGPPGVGKTHLARAIAGEAGVPFFHISGSDFVEMFVGVGAARVRDLFETAKAHKPCLIFIDEIDAVGRQRGAGLGGGHDEREQTLNQLLVEMDGFDPNAGVIMIAATNRPDVLDPALLRPGRFDRQIVVDAPDAKGREAILKIHAKGKPIDEKVEMGVLAKRTPGFTGAELANALNEAALLAARRGKVKIFMDDMEEAIDRVYGGPERRSRVMDDHERRVIAYHEAGHAVVGGSLDKEDPVHKVTILPRGMSLGSTWHLPDKDTYLESEQGLLQRIATLLGGRVAEEIVFGDVTTGASNDLQRVARIARAMVTEYGMSGRLGTLALERGSRNPFLGRDYTNESNYSDEIARQIDEEVRRIVDENHQLAHKILNEKRAILDAMAEALLERETIDREEFLALMRGETLEARETTKVLGEAPPVQGEPAGDKSGAGQTNPRLEPGTA